MEGFFNFVSLNNRIRYTLGRNERLKSRNTIDALFKEGRSFTVYPFRVLYKSAGEQGPDSLPEMRLGPGLKAGFTVSSRHFRRAVDRNRVKRLMRECWRLQKNELQLKLPGRNDGCLPVFLIYIAKEIPPYEWLYQRMTLVLRKLIQATDEKSK